MLGLQLDPANIGVANVEPRRWTDDDMNCSAGADGGGERARNGGISTRAYRVGEDVLVSHRSALGAGVSADRGAIDPIDPEVSLPPYTPMSSEKSREAHRDR